MAVVGVWLIYGRALVIDLEAGGNLLARTVAGGLFVMSIVAAVCWRKEIITVYRKCTAKLLIGTAIAFALSVAIQIATMAAYLSIASSFISTTSPMLLGAVSIIMFVASLPISFAGWGARELSSVAAFGSIGMVASAAFMVGALVGTFSILIVLAIAGVSMRMMSPAGKAHGSGSVVTNSIAIDKTVAPLAAVLVCFSIYVPVASGFVNVTLSDPLALVGAGLFALHCYAKRELPRWGAAQFNSILTALTFVVLLSFAVGAMRFGVTSWASTKATGWFVLLAYLATGALAVRLSASRGVEAVIWPYVVASAAVVLFDLILTALHGMAPLSALAIRPYDYSGFSNNRNAYAFMLVLALGAGMALKTRPALIAATISASGILLSGSRTGMICMAAVFALASLLRFTRRQHIALVGIGALVIYFVVGIGVPMVYNFLSASFQINDLIAVADSASAGGSGQQHWLTIVAGLEMFLAFPIFGAGLGAFVETVHLYATPIVIHSTPVWILAELGLISFAVFALAFARVTVHLWRIRATFAGKVGLVVMATVALFGQGHEILYQRPIWLLLGVVLAVTISSRRVSRA